MAGTKQNFFMIPYNQMGNSRTEDRVRILANCMAALHMKHNYTDITKIHKSSKRHIDLGYVCIDRNQIS